MSFLRGLPVGLGTGSSGGIPGVTIPGTPGSVAFFGSTGYITEDNANWFYDNTNNRVGIGTNAPDGKLHVLQSAEAGGTPILLHLVGGAHTAQAASTEKRDLILDLSRTVTFATGALTTQRAATLSPPTYAFVGASTLANASTLEITGAPIAGANATITRPIALSIVGSSSDLGSLFIGDNSLSTYSTDPISVEIAPAATTSRRRGLRYSGGALTAIAGGELIDLTLTPSNIEFGSGTLLALQRSVSIGGSTISATSAKTITEAATLAVAAPVKGSNVTWSTAATGDSGVFAIKTAGAGGIHTTISGVDGFVPGAAIDFCFGAGAAVNVPAGTEYIAVIGGVAAGDTITWAGAPAATQRWFFLDNPTFARTGGASTITTAATLCVEPPAAGTNITITNAYSMWATGNVRFDAKLEMDTTTPSEQIRLTGTASTATAAVTFRDSTNANRMAIGFANSSFAVAARRRGYIGLYSDPDFTFTDDTNFFFYIDTGTRFVGINTSAPGATFAVVQVTATTGSPTGFQFTGAAHTTLSNAEFIDCQFNLSRTVQFGQNTLLALQRFIVMSSPTISSSVATKTITRASLLAVGVPAAGSNVTITDAYSAEFGAKIRIASAVALGGGAAATLGTIGGSGPAAAGQNEWIAIDTQNGRRFVPCWA